MTDVNSGLPPISVSTADLARLEILAAAAERRQIPVAELLTREIARARVVDTPQIEPGVVTMNASVVYRDRVSEEIRSAILVYPDTADISAGKVSILSPLGAALIGLTVGQSIEFQTPAGGHRSITVLAVTQPHRPGL